MSAFAETLEAEWKRERIGFAPSDPL
jgi:hypothetical protein